MPDENDLAGLRSEFVLEGSAKVINTDNLEGDYVLTQGTSKVFNVSGGSMELGKAPGQTVNSQAKWEVAVQTLSVVFDAPQKAAAPGQFVVFYQGDLCLGGAVIAATR